MPQPQHRYLITKSAKTDLEALTPAVRERIGKKLGYFIESGEPLRYAEKLTNRRDGDYRFRVGNYRVVVAFDGNNIYILRVQHRRDVYRK